jgi:hypothetical protein
MNKQYIDIARVVDEAFLSFATQEFHKGDLAIEDLSERSIARTIDSILSCLLESKGLAVKGSTATLEAASSSVCYSSLRSSILELGRSDAAAPLVGTAFEQLRGKRLCIASDGRLAIETSPEQRSRGVYFTPIALAEATVEPALRETFSRVHRLNDLSRISILDPAAGCGSFLLSAIRTGAELLREKKAFSRIPTTELRSAIARNCIYGVDIDPLAIATIRTLIRTEVGLSEWTANELDDHLRVGDSVSCSRQDWNAWFPEVAPNGFSVVATNPPWSKLRPLRHEFFEHIDRRVRLLQGSELGRYLEQHLRDLVQGSWDEYVTRTLCLSNHLRSSSEYSINQESAGDADLYKYFVERSISLLDANGIAALLLPSGVLRAQGSSVLRRLLLRQGTVANLVEYINRRRIFDIHPMYRFCSILFKKGARRGVVGARFRVERIDVECDSKRVSLGKPFLSFVGGAESLIPEVRTTEERDLLQRIYQQHPTVARAENGWSFAFRRELDMTNDSAAFVDAVDASRNGFQRQDAGWRSKNSSEVLLPVYEGRMVHQFDHTAKEYVDGHGRSAKWTVPYPGAGAASPHYFVTEEYALARGWRPVARAAYCEISGHANERTVLAAVIPPFAICGNKVPVLDLSGGSFDQHLLWVALANSLVVDWVMRRFVSTTVNHFYWQNIPLPPSSNDRATQFLIDASRVLSVGNLHATNAVHWLERRARIRAAIDAVVLDMYRITDDELAILLKDFPAFRSACDRGPTGSASLAELIGRAQKANRRRTLAIGDIDNVFRGLAAAAAYATRDQAVHLKLAHTTSQVSAEARVA